MSHAEGRKWHSFPVSAVFGVCAVCVAAAGSLRAAEFFGGGISNIAAPTLGGKQFWADEFFFHHWRIQRNVITGHFRLLDANDRRHAWGSYESCRAKLDEIQRAQRLPPMKGAAVLVLHGLGRSRASMDKLCKHLSEQGRFAVFNVAYPSTRGEIADHAASLRRIIENLNGIEEIHFVAHSMGNVVIRYYLSERPDPRIKRFVMLAPPNHGSLAALVLADSELFKGIAGEPGRQLGRDWDKLEGKLATPAFEFGIIAGGKGDGRGFNPLLPGDNDATISVETTRLAGASDFTVVPNRHTFIMDDAKVQQYTLRFLQKGYFVSPEKRQPLPKAK